MRIVMLGASGAVGTETLNALLARQPAPHITALVRRPLSRAPHRNLTTQIVDVMSPAAYQHLLTSHDAAICTFGVGEPSKASREDFLRVDKDAVLAFASACRQADIGHFELLGSVAASAQSRSFYLKSKGELRDAIVALNFRRFSIFQPSMILTPENRYGFSQGVLLALWPLLSPLLVAGLRKYRGVKVVDLGRAMASNLDRPGTGFEVLHWPEITHIAQGSSSTPE